MCFGGSSLGASSDSENATSGTVVQASYHEADGSPTDTGGIYASLSLDDIDLVDEGDEGTAYVAGEVLVLFADSTTVAQAQQALESVGLSAAKQDIRECLEAQSFYAAQVEGGASVRDVLRAVCDQEPAAIAYAQANNLYTVAEDSSTEDEAAEDESDDSDAAESLDDDDSAGDAAAADTADATAETSLVEYLADALSNISAATIDDPYAAEYQWHLDTINAYDAWEVGTSDGAVSIAIIDTGVDDDHEDLVGQLVAGYNSVDKSDDFDDDYGHGTHVAGIAAATTNNGIGVSGTSCNANIIPVKANKNADFTDEALLEAYNYLLADEDGNGTSDLVETAGLHVVNMSLGALHSVSSDDALFTAIDAACDQGILTVCAAGNDSTENVGSTDTNWPSDYETCVSVIALDAYDSRASSSNYGDAKDIAAPGESIYSTTYNGSYGTKSGTSMASPVVAGVAALIFAQNENYTPEGVRAILESTARDLGDEGYDTETAWGCVDAAAAMNKTTETCTVTIEGGDNAQISNGEITASSFTEEEVAYGTTLAGTYTAVPDDGWSFQYFIDEDGNEYTDLLDITVTDSMTLTAVCAGATVLELEVDGCEGKLPELRLTGSEVTVDWGDGETTTGSGTVQKCSRYAQAGTYTITIVSNGSYRLGKVTQTPPDITFYPVLDTEYRTGLISVVTASNAGPAGGAFSGCTNLQSADFSECDTSSVERMSYMFNNCSSLESLDLSSFDTSNATTMKNMFNGCSSLASLDLSSFDTSGVTSMDDFLGDCTKLESITLSAEFSFCGSDTERLCDLPDSLLLDYETTGNWVNEDTYASYAYNEVPNNTAATYVPERALDEAAFSLEEDAFTYNGSAFEPQIVVDGYTEGVEFEIAYINNVEAGTGSVIITGINGYGGTISLSFTIVQGTPPALEVPMGLTAAYGDTLSDVTLPDGWSWANPDASVGELGTLTAAACYTVDDTNYDYTGVEGYDVETHTVTATVEVTVEPRTLDKSLFSVDTAQEEYTGGTIAKTVASDLTEGTDYTVSYADNTYPGTATITITGMGNYTGTLSYSFAIVDSTVESLAATASTLLNSTSDADLAGSSYAPLKAKSKVTGKKKATVTWSKVSGATGYVVYGAKCGKKNSYKKIATTTSTKYVHKKLKKGTYYKYVVVAYKTVNGTKQTVAISKTVHVATKGGKVTNPKSVKVASTSVTLSTGKTYKLKGTAVKKAKALKLKKHRAVRYESTNTQVATVGKKGKVTAKGTGTCYVYAYAQNGVCKKVKVTVG